MSLRLSNYRQMKFLPWLTATERKRETGAKCVEFTPPGAAKPASSKQINFWHVKTIQIYIWLRTQSGKPSVTWWRSIVLLQDVYFKLIQGNPNYHFRCSSNPHIHSYSLAVSSIDSTPIFNWVAVRSPAVLRASSGFCRLDIVWDLNLVKYLPPLLLTACPPRYCRKSAPAVCSHYGSGSQNRRPNIGGQS